MFPTNIRSTSIYFKQRHTKELNENNTMYYFISLKLLLDHYLLPLCANFFPTYKPLQTFWKINLNEGKKLTHTQHITCTSFIM